MHDRETHIKFVMSDYGVNGGWREKKDNKKRQDAYAKSSWNLHIH